MSQCSPNAFLPYIYRWSSTQCRKYIVAYYIVFAMRNEYSIVISKKKKPRYCIIGLHCNAWSNYLSIFSDRHVLHLMCIDINLYKFINLYIIYLEMPTVRSEIAQYIRAPL